MAPTQSNLHSHGVTSKAPPIGSPGKRQKTNEPRSAANAPQVTPAKNSMEVYEEEESASEAAERNDSTMEEAGNTDATEANEDDSEEEKADKAATAKKQACDRVPDLLRQNGHRTASEQGGTTTSPPGNDEEEESDDETDGLENNA